MANKARTAPDTVRSEYELGSMPRRVSALVAHWRKGWCLGSNTPPDAPLKPDSAPALHASLPDLSRAAGPAEAARIAAAWSRGPGHVEHEKKTFFS